MVKLSCNIDELRFLISWLGVMDNCASFHPLMLAELPHFYQQQKIILSECYLKIHKAEFIWQTKRKSKMKISFSKSQAISLHEFIRCYPISNTAPGINFVRNYLLNQLNNQLQ